MKYVKWIQMHDYVQKRKPPGFQELFSSSFPPPREQERDPSSCIIRWYEENEERH